MTNEEQAQLLDKTAELYWEKVQVEANGFREHLKTVNWQQLLLIGGLTGVYAIAEKYWEVKEGDEVLGVSQESLKNLLLDLIRMKLEESLQEI